MRLPRVRFTVRRMMAVVAVVALVAGPFTVIEWAPGSGRGSLERRLARLDAGRLDADAGRLWVRYGEAGRGNSSVPEMEWTPAIRGLTPLRVYVSPHGVYVATRSFFVEESGLFILPASSPFKPGRGTAPDYRKLMGNFFWYHIKG